MNPPEYQDRHVTYADLLRHTRRVRIGALVQQAGGTRHQHREFARIRARHADAYVSAFTMSGIMLVQVKNVQVEIPLVP